MRVSYMGIKGAFGEEAARKLYPDAELVACESFARALNALDMDEADIAVLPIENSLGGAVVEVEDLVLRNTKLNIIAEVKLEINHYLLQRAGDGSKVKITYSHPQALAQCRDYLAAHDIQARVDTNTAVSARRVSEGEIQSAVASAYAAEVWGLKCTAGPIQDHAGNTTRFWALSKEKLVMDGHPCAFTIVYATDNIPGALRKSLEPFDTHGCNLTRLESRPTPSSAWEYHFIAEGAAGEGVNFTQLVDDLRKVTTELRILGLS